MSFDRMFKASDDLVGALGLRGKGSVDRIAESDARRYVVKTMRELRHQLALGGQADIPGVTEKVVEHLGVPAGASAVAAALTVERDAFLEDKKAAPAGHVFHEDHGFVHHERRGDPSQVVR